VLGTDVFCVVGASLLALALVFVVRSGRGGERLDRRDHQSPAGLMIGGVVCSGFALVFALAALWMLVNDPGGVVWTRRIGSVHRWAIAPGASVLSAWLGYSALILISKASRS
jgi:hypothetical protein